MRGANTLIAKSLRIQGFMFTDWGMEQVANAERQLAAWLASGRMVGHLTLIDDYGWEHVGKTFERLFRAHHLGKLILRVG